MPTGIVSPASGRVGQGYLIQTTLGGIGVAGDLVDVAITGLGIVSQHAPVTAGATVCFAMWGWNYPINLMLSNLPGLVDNTAISLDVNWYSSAFVLKGTNTIAGYNFDPVSWMPLLIQFSLGRYSNTTLTAILNAVQKIFQNAP
jgi:hypothetical protein